jgi:hypothetical protein
MAPLAQAFCCPAASDGIVTLRLMRQCSAPEAFMDSHNISPKTINLIISLLALLFAPSLWIVGVLAADHPVCMVCWAHCQGTGSTAESVSHYYCWSDATRDLFVGALTGLGFLFLAYRGWARKPGRLDHMMAVWCALLAFAVANFPTSSAFNWVHLTHVACAVSLFITLSWIALCRFSDRLRDREERNNIAWKFVRNGIYGFCAALMVIGMLYVGIGFLLEFSGHGPLTTHYKFCGEALALTAFGMAWLVKSRFLLGYSDKTCHFFAYRPGWEKLAVFRLLRQFGGHCWICKLRKPLARLLGPSEAEPARTR